MNPEPLAPRFVPKQGIIRLLLPLNANSARHFLERAHPRPT